MKTWHKWLSIYLLLLCASSNLAAFSALGGELPPESVKILPMANEPSVSTYIQGEQGKIAVNVMYPSMTRYDRGAPVAVIVPGNKRASGLSISSHTVQVGFCEVRFAFPGGGLKDFHTDGSWDERGVASQKVLRDVLLFACSKKTDVQGKSLSELLPKKVDTKNVGILSWHDGGNITLVTLSKFTKELEQIQPNLKWLAFCEPQVGSLFNPSILGTKKELVVNQYYKHGSAATGRLQIDFSKLRFDREIYRNKLIRDKQKMTTPKGVLYFDDNSNGTWQEEIEFPIPYATLPNVNKQFYAPEIVGALVRLKLFAPIAPKPKTEQTPPPEENKEKKRLSLPSIKFKDPPRVLPVPVEKTELIDTWPPTIARLGESLEYFQERDGSLCVDSVVKSYPNVLISIFASKVDLNEQQIDHPNIIYLYNLFLSARPKWLRLNPDPLYAGFVADMNDGNFINNKPNCPLESDKIETYLESEGLVTDHVFMEATIAELADRAAANNLKALPKVIKAYLNEARLLNAMNQTPTTKSGSEATSGPGPFSTSGSNSSSNSSSSSNSKQGTAPVKTAKPKETPRDANLRDEEWDWPAEFDEK